MNWFVFFIYCFIHLIFDLLTHLLKKIIEILEPYEVTLSRLEKTGRDILICRITKNEKALTEDQKNRIINRIQKLIKTNKRQ